MSKMHHNVSGLHNLREFSQPSECLDEANNPQKYVRIQNVTTVFTYSHLNIPIDQ